MNFDRLGKEAGWRAAGIGRAGGDPLPLRPVRDPRFASFRTQPLENLSAAVKPPIKKRFLGNPTLGTNLGSRILAMRTGCTANLRTTPNLPTDITPTNIA